MQVLLNMVARSRNHCCNGNIAMPSVCSVESHLAFIGPCIVIYSYNKTNEMH